jgi:hypothetical protein
MKDREENFEKLLSMTPPIDDDGFTENLMRQLPPQRDVLRIRTTLLLAFTFAACAIVAAVPGARHFLAEFVSGFASSSVVADLSLLTTAVLAALLIWGAVAAATSDA